MSNPEKGGPKPCSSCGKVSGHEDSCPKSSGESEGGPTTVQEVVEKQKSTFENMPRSMAVREFEKNLNQFTQMAEGGDANGVRDKYYPDMSDEQFEELVERLQEERENIIG